MSDKIREKIDFERHAAMARRPHLQARLFQIDRQIEHLESERKEVNLQLAQLAGIDAACSEMLTVINAEASASEDNGETEAKPE